MVAQTDICEVCDGTGLLLHTPCPLCGDEDEEQEDSSDESDSDISSEDSDSDDERALSLLPPAQTRWIPGSRVRCIRFGKGSLRPARVTAVHSDSTYSVAYNDGHVEAHVPNFHMKSPCLKSCTKLTAKGNKLSRTQRSKCALAEKFRKNTGDDSWLVPRKPLAGAGDTLSLEGPILALLRNLRLASGDTDAINEIKHVTNGYPNA